MVADIENSGGEPILGDLKEEGEKFLKKDSEKFRKAADEANAMREAAIEEAQKRKSGSTSQ